MVGEIRGVWSAQDYPPVADGVISRHGSDHMALLVNGLFNASVSKPAAPLGSEHECGQQVPFIVQSLNVSDGLLSMLGELCEETTSAQTVDANKGGKKHKRRKTQSIG